MTDQNDKLWLMLGEMRSDLKTLVHARAHTNARLDSHIDDTELRLKSLESFKTRIAALTAFLGVTVPTAITIFATRMGIL